MPKKTLDVSVVIPCFNANNTLGRCLESISLQTSRPREIIVIDDGSDEPIANLIKELQNRIDIPIKFLAQRNSGAPVARNVGLMVATSKYVAFLDADDIWLPRKLEIQYHVMEVNSLLLSGHGYAFNFDAESKLSNNSRVKVRRINRNRFIYGNPLFTPTVMVTRSEFTLFDENFRRVDDYKAWLEHFEPDRYMMIDSVLAAGFKPPIGHSGLTGSVEEMHRAFVAVLNALYISGKIGAIFYLLALTIEAVKFPVRRRNASRRIKSNK